MRWDLQEAEEQDANPIYTHYTACRIPLLDLILDDSSLPLPPQIITRSKGLLTICSQRICSHEESLSVVVFNLQCILTDKVEKGPKWLKRDLIVPSQSSFERLRLKCYLFYEYATTRKAFLSLWSRTHISRFGIERAPRRLERSHHPPL
jgi:hypothetical protein